MSHQQTTAPSPPLLEESALPTLHQVEVGSWEPYLDLMKSWQRADAICAKAVERADATRTAEESRARSTFESDKAKLESAHKERLNNIEAARKFARDNSDTHLAQAQAVQTRVRKSMETLGLEALMDNIDVSPSFERGNADGTIAALRDTVAQLTTVENSLQEDLFDLRAARQRESAGIWAVGIGLWFVAVLVFAPYSWMSALLVAVAAFVIATPRRVENDEILRPSFSAHVGHCLALLFGKQQVMQRPFSLLEKDRTLSTNALVGSVATASMAWLVLLMVGSPTGYGPIGLLKHLGIVSLAAFLAGAVTFTVANHDLTFPELTEGEKNRILK